jgi:hypothetical protein
VKTGPEFGKCPQKVPTKSNKFGNRLVIPPPIVIIHLLLMAKNQKSIRERYDEWCYRHIVWKYILDYAWTFFVCTISAWSSPWASKLS